MNIENIKEKIAKLMAMAMDGRGNEHEAETALRQAKKLMTMHNIELADVQAATGQKPTYKFISTIIPQSPKPMTQCTTWCGILSLAIATLTDTKVSWCHEPTYGKCLRFMGEESDVHYAAYLFKMARDRVRAESAEFVGSRREKEDFRIAMVGRIAQRVNVIKAEQEAELRAHVTSSGTALAVVADKIALRDEQFGPQRVKNGPARRSSHHGSEAGRAAGDRVSFNRAIGQNRHALGN